MKKIFICLAISLAVSLSAFDFTNVLNSAKSVATNKNTNGNYKSLIEKALNLSVQELSKKII
ncbi:hypothetical protein [Campylobacter blaseri]|uniref:hypothetical protein n=1 Tax=Campylobacter blaseri TaxID=2042961 RepID=UPI000D118E83|nr:hypothetical protein [Campylobacter blaseri]